MMKQDKKTGLTPYRRKIDAIDQQIIQLLQERFDVARDIIRYKQRVGMPILDAGREQEKLEALREQVAPEKRTYIEEILRQMMAQSRRYQAEHPLQYGLLGRSLGHSHSPRIHKLLADYDYGLFEREPQQLAEFFADASWRGINVTIPYKREVMAYCDALSETAIKCNSVNTIVRRPAAAGNAGNADNPDNLDNLDNPDNPDNPLGASSLAAHSLGASSSAGHASSGPELGKPYITWGANTDYDGFRYVIERSGIHIRGKALVLGSGGVSGTVAQVLRDLGAQPVVVISRSGQDNYTNLHRHEDAQIIVNTTPVGMFPKAGEAVIDIHAFPACRAVYDLIYNPLRTKLMLDAQKAGIPAFGGLPMLVAQAAKAAEIFASSVGVANQDVRAWVTSDEEASRNEESAGSSRRIDTRHHDASESGIAPDIPASIRRETWIEGALHQLQRSLEHVILIGMPGAGKTTAGKILAEKTGRVFLDLDEAIREAEGRSPEAIIREDGVDHFRSIESRMLRRILREGEGIPSSQGVVLATGGGIVERDENREILQENGLVIWLRRPLEELPTGGRPVSQREGLPAIYERRRPRYEAWSDLTVDACGKKKTGERILQILQER